MIAHIVDLVAFLVGCVIVAAAIEFCILAGATLYFEWIVRRRRARRRDYVIFDWRLLR